MSMSTQVADITRKRAAAKGFATRVGKAVELLLTMDLSKLDQKQLLKSSASLDKSEQSFYTHHESLWEADVELTEEAHGKAAQDYDDGVSAIRANLKGLESCRATYDILLTLQGSLEALEAYVSEPYADYLETRYLRTQELILQFTEARAQSSALANAQLLDGKNNVLNRWKDIQRWKGRTAPPAALPSTVHEPTATAEVAHYHQSTLKTKLPTFDGSYLLWRDFWEMFTSLIAQEPRMPTPQKKVLLLEAMTTETAKDTVRSAFAYTSTWDEAVASLKDTYDRNRDLHLHHQRDAFRIQYRGDDHESFRLMQDQIKKNLRGLKAAKGMTAEQIFTAHYEDQMIPTTLRRWRDFSAKYTEVPPVSVLLEFIDLQIKSTSPSLAPSPTASHVALASVVGRSEKKTPTRQKPVPKVPTKSVLQAQAFEVKCYMCQSNHAIYRCPQFAGKTVAQRKAWVKSGNRCANCFTTKHSTAECNGKGRCRECFACHHTLLHDSKDVSVNVTLVPALGEGECNIPGTAVVTVRHGAVVQKTRALMDTGAQVCLITDLLAQKLQGKRERAQPINIIGMGGTTLTHWRLKVTLIGLEGEMVTITPYIVDTIPPTDSGACVAEAFKRPFLKDLKPLADPEYISMAPVDLLLSYGTFNDCTKGDVHRLIDRGLRAEPTIFGWVLGGRDVRCLDTEPTQRVCLRTTISREDSVDRLLQRYWEAEQFSTEEFPTTPDETKAIEHFQDHVRRDEEGRYSVSLPRKIPTPQLGLSRGLALKRCVSTEKSIRKQGLWDAFNETMDDYDRRDHAELVPEAEMAKNSESSYYLPVHIVLKPSSTTTKMRAVFDASAPTTSGASLNATLLPGPSLYPLLSTVINRFRAHRIGMTADISRMFREVGLNPEEMDYHRFLRRGEDGQIQDWRMKRLTFGVTSSPYLATQVLRQVAIDHSEKYPRAARIIREQFYVDDCLTGADSIEEAQSLRKELCDLLMEACMTLRKWRSNSEELLQDIPEELKETSDLPIAIAPGECQKSLGLHWSNGHDSLHVATPEVDATAPATKRSVASAVARTFDLMGWFSPATLPAKYLLQQAWLLKLDWDVPLPAEFQTKWKVWVRQLDTITDHPISRYAGHPDKTPVSRQLHGYSDASQLAYGGVVYLRTLYDDDTVSVHLIASKPRVAPIATLTVPRLELCGALILAQLLQSISTDFLIEGNDIYAWTDAAVIIGWLNRPVTQLTVYVANRVAKILSLVPSERWRYVSTSQNPADLLTRGVMPSDLLVAHLWWDGPPWLVKDLNSWPRRPDINLGRELVEPRPSVLQVSVGPVEMCSHISSYTRLVRIVAWIWRFYVRTKHKREQSKTLYLTTGESRWATTLLLRHSQSVSHGKAIAILKSGNALPTHHELSALTPYIDEEGMLRVGGRLQNSELEQAVKHPLILCTQSHIVLILVRSTHQRLMHAGSSTVMATMAPTFHIPNLKTLLRKISRECVTCQRTYARTSEQLMGELPADRIKPAQPFSVVGLDYAGPILSKRGNPRKPTMVKTYIMVVVCLVTRAVHLEVVADMSTPAFLAALSRFACKRGAPAVIYSDNGSNFRGAQAELKQALTDLQTSTEQDKVEQWAAMRGIEWNFSPARAPHFGGIWEAAVKAMKGLLKKTTADRTLALDELMTFVAEAEAVLNSRPMIPIDSPADDAIEPLTPGHFLTGGPIRALPLIPDTTTKLTLLRRWDLVRRLTNDLWTRWKTEYVIMLQRRNKWKKPHRNLEVGDIVILKDVDSFQRTWPLGRVTRVFPGKDGLVRAVEVRSQEKTLMRPIHKLVYLLGEEDDGSSPRGEYVRAGTGVAGLDDEDDKTADAAAEGR